MIQILKIDPGHVEKRRPKRFVERCKIEFIANDKIYRGISGDFSLNGLFIRTNHPLPPETILKLVIYLPNGLTSKLKGKVKRALEVSLGKMTEPQKYLQRGIGVEITERDSNYLHFIGSLLDLEILRKRYAWSEISTEEFEEQKKIWQTKFQY
jgi:hypothetical protein